MSFLAALLRIVNGTLGCRGTPVGNHWFKGLFSNSSYRSVSCS